MLSKIPQLPKTPQPKYLRLDRALGYFTIDPRLPCRLLAYAPFLLSLCVLPFAARLRRNQATSSSARPDRPQLNALCCNAHCPPITCDASSSRCATSAHHRRQFTMILQARTGDVVDDAAERRPRRRPYEIVRARTRSFRGSFLGRTLRAATSRSVATPAQPRIRRPCDVAIT